MRSIKTTLVLALCTVCAAFSAAAGSGGQEEKAKALLQKTLERTFPQNVVAIILQMSPEGGATQRIQVQISKEGKKRQTVLYPLSMEGVEAIDDGRRSSTYLPDEKLLVIQESPQLLPNDANKRINLTVKNYDLKLGNSATIAGRTATLVVATPRNRELETRRYYIDEKTGFVLQLETVDRGGSAKVAFRTEAVQYPSSIPSSVFYINTEPGRGQTVQYHRRTGLYESPKFENALGFAPVLPDDLPCGFSLQDAQINEGQQVQWRSLAVRVTDGLVKGTVYQWSASNQSRIKTMPGTTVGEAGGLVIVVAADIPEAARRKLLQKFLDAANKDDNGPTASMIEQMLELSLRQISFSQRELTFRLYLIADQKSLF